MTRQEAEVLVWAEMNCCLGLFAEIRGRRPIHPTLQRAVSSIVQRLVIEGGLVLDDDYDALTAQVQP